MDAEPYLADRSTLPKTKGALRMRHRMKRRKCDGDVYVSSEFSVICKDEEDNQELLTTVFGYVHKGLGVCEYISRLNSSDNKIVVHSCGTWVDVADEEMEQTCAVLPTTRFIAPTGDDPLAQVLGSNLCYVQLSIDGDVQPKIFFHLDFDAAPSMCEVFLECCQSTIDSSLSYKTSPVAEVSKYLIVWC
jgi:cyclophilin family peptidyl-prolyl cis-trans isomerase